MQHAVRRAFRISYALTRVPISVMDRVLVQRLPAHSPTRTAFDHGLGVTDHWMGLILGDARIVHSGRLRVEHAGRYTGSYTDMAPSHQLTTTKSYASTRIL